ncbi:MAG: FAD-dependent oxidoreductase [Propionibacteriales bacterium]|nr:FAD-dependent oxidoreductase [Propionibacteriales bacterium]
MVTASYDVVVVGAGNAALVTALSAHEAGARVLVLEAAPREERGGNSRFSGGIFRIAHDGPDSLEPLLTAEAREWLRRIDFDPYPAERYLGEVQRLAAGRSDHVLVKRLVDDSYRTAEWMRDQGVRWELAVGKIIDPENVDEDTTYRLPAGGAMRATEEGVGLMDDLFAAVERAGIDVWYDSPVHELVLDGTSVTGVVVRTQDSSIEVSGVVVLAAGGFEANPEMRLRYLGPGWDLVKVRGSRFNMGTVLSKALQAGAQPAGHWGGCHASPLDADAPAVGDLRLTDRMSRYSYPYALLVNSAGERFIDEGEDEVWLTYAKTGAAIREQPHAVAFQIFDQKTIHLLEPRYETGVPVEADSLAALAEKLEIPADALSATVADFNAATTAGEFEPFRKDGLRADPAGQPAKSNWAQPVDTPPYVCYRVTCGITFTYGGVKIDEGARVIDTTGRPMPGLYATGELAGDFFYHNYPGGSGLTRGAVFGRIAGQAAAERATG